MFLFLMIVLTLLFWVISIFFNDVEDELQYRYKNSVFDWIPKHIWLSWYMMDPDVTWDRKYVNSDPGQGRKKWFGIIIPAFIFDGWHGAKIIRQGFQYLTVFSGLVVGYLSLPFYIPLWIIFVSGLICFALFNHFAHNVWFFDGMLLKKYWKKPK